nr:PREDICTED: interleukin-1 receptor type 1 isoform X4 [Apteryx mantelli mantelli]
MQKMISAFLLIVYLILVTSPFNAGECSICDYYVLVGEPTAISCPIITFPVLHSDYNLTWYKNGSVTPVTTEKHARIHQRDGLLWFIPATLEDSGLYECDVRRLNHSNKKPINLTVFKNDNGLCFNGQMKFEQKVMSTNTGKIICPDLEYFRDEDNNEPEVRWYKECKPGFLEDKRLLLAEGENAILIRNVTVQDKGNYTCRIVYTYMGKQYNVSRTVSLEVKESPLQTRPEFIYPQNNTIEVDLGSPVVMECNISSGIPGLIPFWKVNDEDVDSFDSTYKEQFYEEGMPHGLAVSGTKFNISEVKVKDYAHKFFCHVVYDYQQITAYIKLERPAVISTADEKIRQSRRVIIVLVPEPSCYSILEDVSEKQLAMYNALIREGIKVILIELEKIQDYANMPESIKYIKQKHGAIRWKGDFSEKSYSASSRFWKKVRYHMPSRKNRSSSGLHLLPKDFNSPQITSEK